MQKHNFNISNENQNKKMPSPIIEDGTLVIQIPSYNLREWDLMIVISSITFF